MLFVYLMTRARDKKFTIYKDKSKLILNLDKNSLIYGKEDSQAYMLHVTQLYIHI